MQRLTLLPLSVTTVLSLTVSTLAHANPAGYQFGQYQQPVYVQPAHYAAPQPRYSAQRAQYQQQYQPQQYQQQYQQPVYRRAAYQAPQFDNPYPQEIIPQQQYQQRPIQRFVPFQQSAQYAPPVEQRIMVQAPRTTSLPPERRAILDLAHQVLGVRYKYGGNSVREGLDCSSLIQLTHRPLGRKIPRTAAEQSKASRTISRQELRPGDLIFFNTLGKGVSHVGIYLKNGNFIHAASGGGRVMVDNLSKNYWQKRIVKYGTFVG